MAVISDTRVELTLVGGRAVHDAHSSAGRAAMARLDRAVAAHRRISTLRTSSSPAAAEGPSDGRPIYRCTGGTISCTTSIMDIPST
ncbi:hypothetical protein ACFCYB_02840 [Streptomyces sp. NPDC056309]|uniref:hypothetical protein n=1 Tax=unclassified Streptomyces TaxID=2593676 RepID=UPI0035D71E53